MTDELVTIKQQLENTTEAAALFGVQDIHLKRLEEELQVSIVTRGELVHVSGSSENVQIVEHVFQHLLTSVRSGISISERDVLYAIHMIKTGKTEQLSKLDFEEIAKNSKGKAIRAKTLGQKKYVAAIKQSDLVFGIGPAGTGKTYLAVVMAVTALKQGMVKKIILTRPAVEAGERLGFLPGDLKEKVDPYLRPLYDALNDVLGTEHTQRMIERGTIEIAPLAYMRGRTLEDAFAILDEAQNTTNAQLKMFLTRLGFGSKMIITGDVTQIDLPTGVRSGLVVAKEALDNVRGIRLCYLEQSDIVRHPLVSKVIAAYEQSGF